MLLIVLYYEFHLAGIPDAKVVIFEECCILPTSEGASFNEIFGYNK